MTIASGVAKRVAYKKESTWNTAPGASGAQNLRRIKSTLELAKATYQSAEIRADYQVEDFRHGYRSVKGAIEGELSAGTWKDFLASLCRAAFATFTPIASLSITIAGSGPTYTVTRGSGSWISDGVKLYDVVRLTAGAFNAANLNKNLFVLAETATILTVIPLNGVAMVAEGPIATSTLTRQAKKNSMPLSGFTDDSYSIEHWYSDIALSEVFTGCKINAAAFNLPPTGMATVSWDFMGGNVNTAGSQYFASPTAETTTKILAGVNGALGIAGSQVGLVTGCSMNVKANMQADPVVGQNTYAFIVAGRMEVSGQVSFLFQDATFRDDFLNETEISLGVVLSDSGSATADYLAFVLPRIKLGAATRDDGEKGLILSCPFTALLNSAGGAGTTSDATTFAVQDSQA